MPSTPRGREPSSGKVRKLKPLAKVRRLDTSAKPRSQAPGRKLPPAGKVRKLRTVARAGQPILRRTDVRQILRDLSDRLAPADLQELMSHESGLRARAAALEGEQLDLLRHQLALALDCLHDHLDNRCPQIPYVTIALLAAAISYFAQEMDVIPDFLPRVGRLDDAVVMAMACQMTASDLRRYCDATGRVSEPALGVRGLRRLRVLRSRPTTPRRR